MRGKGGGFRKVVENSRCRSSLGPQTSAVRSYVKEHRYLRSGHYFVRCGGETEDYAVFLIRFEGGGQVKLRNGNLFRPVSVGPVIAARVDHARDNRVVARLLAMTISEDESSRWRLNRYRRCYRLLTRRTRALLCGLGFRFRDIIGLIGASAGAVGIPPDIAIALPLDHERRHRLRFF